MNLKDLYSAEQVMNLLGRIPIEPVYYLGKKPMYDRVAVNEIIEDQIRENPRDMFTLRQKIWGEPAYDLNLDRWIIYDRVLEMWPFSHLPLMVAKNTHDRLKIIKTQTVYGMLLYSLDSLEYYINLKPPTEYYQVSWLDMQKYNAMENKYAIETNPDKLDAWYTPRECAIVVNVPGRYLWEWSKRVTVKSKRWGKPNLWYIPEVHEWLRHNDHIQSYKTAGWWGRHIYLMEYRLQDFWFKDWIIKSEWRPYTHLTDSTFKDVVINWNVNKYDFGGIKIYEKAGVVRGLKGMADKGKIIFPLISRTGVKYKTREKWEKALSEW